MNSANLPPGCGTLPGEEDEQLDNRYLAEAFPDNEGPNSLYRDTYKHTACGPFLSVEIAYWDSSSEAGPLTKQVDCDELRELGTWADMDKRGELVTALLVGSIVEGSDAETSIHCVEVKQLDEEPGEFVARFNAAVEAVDTEADELWNEAND